ncbi:hypothetical protein EDB89DRAFT_763811 [Lactarius sanguifluus]|nr:hypothetical protein EDB89DRAFT_763811 [Lactarius sanguifluus]
MLLCHRHRYKIDCPLAVWQCQQTLSVHHLYRDAPLAVNFNCPLLICHRHVGLSRKHTPCGTPAGGSSAYPSEPQNYLRPYPKGFPTTANPNVAYEPRFVKQCHAREDDKLGSPDAASEEPDLTGRFRSGRIPQGSVRSTTDRIIRNAQLSSWRGHKRDARTSRHRCISHRSMGSSRLHGSFLTMVQRWTLWTSTARPHCGAERDLISCPTKIDFRTAQRAHLFSLLS